MWQRLKRWLSEELVLKDLVTNRYRVLHAQWILGPGAQDAPDDYVDSLPPTHVAAGSGTAGVSPETLIALVSEMARVEIITKEVREVGGTVAKFTSQFPEGVATGTWREVGLFNAAEAVELLSACDSIGTAGTGPTVWSFGGNVGSLEITDYREGVAAIKAVGTSPNPRFQNSQLGMFAESLTTSAYLQFFYYVDDVDSLAGDLEVRVGNDPGNYWQFNIAHGDLEEGWQWISVRVSDYSAKIGTPLFSNPINYFFLGYSVSLSASLTDRIDFIRLFTESGDMYCRGEFSTSADKELTETRHVVWRLRVLGQ